MVGYFTENLNDRNSRGGNIEALKVWRYRKIMKEGRTKCPIRRLIVSQEVSIMYNTSERNVIMKTSRL